MKASLGFDLVFPRLIECVLLFVHPCRVIFLKAVSAVMDDLEHSFSIIDKYN